MNFGGLFRGLRRRPDDNRATPAPARTEAPAAPAPAAPVYTPPPTPSRPAPAPAPQPAAAPVAAGLASDIDVPLQPILEKLPQDLRAKMTMKIEELGDASLSIATDQILPQLAVGSVKITFGQLRGAAPDLFKVAEEYDSLPIQLPLGILLAKMNPSLLPRNPQRTIEVPPEIKGPFGARAEGVSFATSFMKSPEGRKSEAPSSESPTKMIQGKSLASPPPAFARPASPAPSTPIVPSTPLPPPPAVRPPMPSAPKPMVSPSALTPPTPRDAVPAAPKPSMPPISVNPAVPHPTRPVSMTPPVSMAPSAPPAAPVVPPAPKLIVPSTPLPPPPSPKPIVPPVAKVEPAAPETPRIPSPAPAPVAGGDTITVSMADLSEKWPEPLKAEIRQVNLVNAAVNIPISAIEPGLKRGRIIYPWQTIRSWANASGVSANDGIELELPLKAITTLYFERRSLNRPAARTAVDRTIPNLFFGFPSAEMEAPVSAPAAVVPPSEPKPAPAAPAAPVVPATPPLRAVVPPAPAAPKPVMPTPVPPARPAVPVQPAQPSEAADTNFFIPTETVSAPVVDQSAYSKPVMSDTELKRRLSTPKEIVERAMAMPGVVGAVIALPDGLKVAAQVPAELNPDTVAAFIPQIFDRVGQSTRELRMGALNNLKFTVGNVPWKIFRVNAVYFAAFGRVGERLPTAELAKLATELDRKTK